MKQWVSTICGYNYVSDFKDCLPDFERAVKASARG